MAIVIFYSWQSDTDVKKNKYFIKDALEKAIKNLNSEIKIEDSERDEFELDHDTSGIPGSPEIVATILKKIDDCGISVADLTFVADVKNKHGVSNPNVLTERGYASKSVGE